MSKLKNFRFQLLFIFQPTKSHTVTLTLSLSKIFLSSLKSNLVPTRIMGVLGQKYFISVYHLALTFSNEGGFTIEKHIRKTSV